MFSNKPTGSKPNVVAAKEAVPARPRKPLAASLLGADLVFEGKLSGLGEVHLDGRIVGDIQVDRLVVGETGAVEGVVEAEAVDIRGRVVGSIQAVEVRIASTAHVEADITHHQLAMETGAYFQGRCTQLVEEGATPPSLHVLLAQTAFGAESA